MMDGRRRHQPCRKEPASEETSPAGTAHREGIVRSRDELELSDRLAPYRLADLLAGYRPPLDRDRITGQPEHQEADSPLGLLHHPRDKRRIIRRYRGGETG